MRFHALIKLRLYHFLNYHPSGLSLRCFGPLEQDCQNIKGVHSLQHFCCRSAGSTSIT